MSSMIPHKSLSPSTSSDNKLYFNIKELEEKRRKGRGRKKGEEMGEEEKRRNGRGRKEKKGES
jgi:hypothetical protein